jgi:hypothetical protein
MEEDQGKKVLLHNVIAVNVPVSFERQETYSQRHPGIALDAAGSA